jgi:hypothetical protein
MRPHEEEDGSAETELLKISQSNGQEARQAA